MPFPKLHAMPIRRQILIILHLITKKQKPSIKNSASPHAYCISAK